MDIQVLRVSGNSNINAVSDAIVEHALKDSIIHVDCIGVKASYVTVKAFIQATEFLVKNSYKFNLRPYYIRGNTTGEGMESTPKTAIRWTMIVRRK